MSALLELVKEAKARRDFSQLAEAIPYVRFLGIHLNGVDGALIGTMTYDRHLIGNPALPALHGGTIGALLESTAVFQILWDAETVVLPKTITITVDYLRSGKPEDTYARAEITRQGKRVVTVSAEAWQSNRAEPIARAHGHFLILPIE